MIDDLIGISHIESQLSSLFRQLRELERLRLAQKPGVWRPNVDIIESESELEIIFELPGVVALDVSAEIRERVLYVKGFKRPPSVPSGGCGFVCMERLYGEFACEIVLDQDADAQQATASLKDGELRITLPKIAPDGEEVIRLRIIG
ncbi:MAG TPA: Hsp20/alpha crystallin family protein [Acidobacteriota bacterium]|nr:Hsp20/alpha crystallin family protein [Acidobacteriota bacterium]